MGVETVIGYISYLRRMFLWLDDSGRIELPRRFERLFRVKRSKLLTPQERQQQGAEIETFTIDELQRLAVTYGKPSRSIVQAHGTIKVQSYIDYFGSWSQAVKAAKKQWLDDIFNNH